MRMMGLKVWLSWLAWFVKYLIMMLAIVSILVLLFHVPIGEGAVIKYTLESVTFMFFFLYALTVITFCFMVSTFFSKGLLLVNYMYHSYPFSNLHVHVHHSLYT